MTKPKPEVQILSNAMKAAVQFLLQHGGSAACVIVARKDEDRDEPHMSSMMVCHDDCPWTPTEMNQAAFDTLCHALDLYEDATEEAEAEGRVH